MTGSWQPRVQLTHELEQHGIVASAFLDRALREGLTVLRIESWATASTRSTCWASRAFGARSKGARVRSTSGTGP